ncbi:MAG TPA: SUMF1/EgtB/PvdO family nonheme iron enzyme [Opitutaceae bacterium]|nr:SUMF1/EgtB/PvdO family nonheme iron enzyme [Opitutaceae bacterium]
MDELDLGSTIKGFTSGQRLFGRYALQRLLGRGGMGVVWLARDEELGRDTALKFLPEAVALDRAALDDLKREVRRAIDLAHPHIVKIHDFVTDGRTAAVSMEFVGGDTLSSLRVDQPNRVFTVAQLEPWLRQLCAALEYAHGVAQVVHRDLKPANLMVNARGDLKVLDFGIAASLAESVTRVSKQAGSSGTPVYMSPQQMMGERPAVTDDIYAIGATLYELLTGKPPFYAGNVMLQVQSKIPPPLSVRREELGVKQEAVPAAWEETIAACLAKEPEGRPRTAAEVARRLGLAGNVGIERTQRATETRPGHAGPATAPSGGQRPGPGRKAGLIIGLAAALALASGAGWYWGVHRPEQARLAELARLEIVARAEADAKERVRLEAETLRLRAEQEQAAAAARQAAARGTVVVRSSPPGARVRIGALDRTTPAEVNDQRPGRYPVRVSHEGYEEWAGEVEVRESEVASLDVELVRSTGRVVITGTRGAEVFDGEKKLGEVPLRLEAVPTGPVRYAVRRQGYVDEELAGSVERNREVTFSVALTKDSGPEPGQSWTIPGLRLDLVPIAAGSFQMGSDVEPDERPIRRVTLPRRFWMGKTEVTQAQWEAVMGSNPSHYVDAERPVETVSWGDALEFCRQLTEREQAAGRLPAGYVYTLPTEAQWEYACRAGSTGYYAGKLADMGWYEDNSGGTGTQPVGAKRANAWGLHDMHGNVAEWCLDWYDYGYPPGDEIDPVGAESGENRVQRGGWFLSDAGDCRSAHRGLGDSGERSQFVGFRVVLSPVR